MAATTGTTVTTSTNCCCCCRRHRPLFPRRLPCLHHYTMADAVFLTGMKPPTVTIFVCPKNSELNWSITIFDIKFESIWHFLQPTSLTLISNCREHCYKNGFWSQFKNVSEQVKPMFYDTADSLHTWLNQACQTKEVRKVIPLVSSVLFKLQLCLVGCLICSTTSVTCQLCGILGIITVPSLVFFVLKILFFKLCLV